MNAKMYKKIVSVWMRFKEDSIPVNLKIPSL